MMKRGVHAIQSRYRWHANSHINYFHRLSYLMCWESACSQASSLKSEREMDDMLWWQSRTTILVRIWIMACNWIIFLSRALFAHTPFRCRRRFFFSFASFYSFRLIRLHLERCHAPWLVSIFNWWNECIVILRYVFLRELFVIPNAIAMGNLMKRARTRHSSSSYLPIHTPHRVESLPEC